MTLINEINNMKITLCPDHGNLGIYDLTFGIIMECMGAKGGCRLIPITPDLPKDVLFEEGYMRHVLRTIVNHNVSEFDLRDLLDIVGINADNGLDVRTQTDNLKLRARPRSWWPWFLPGGFNVAPKKVDP